MTLALPKYLQVSKVYIGEDTPTQALFLKGMLSRGLGLEPIVFGDGLDLYLAIQKDPPDLVISDILLPGIQGLALARLIRFHDDTQHIPLILVSSMKREEIGPLLDIGADAFLPKPVSLPDLKSTVQNLLSSSLKTS